MSTENDFSVLGRLARTDEDRPTWDAERIARWRREAWESLNRPVPHRIMYGNDVLSLFRRTGEGETRAGRTA